jgi:hypothetical protein
MSKITLYMIRVYLKYINGRMSKILDIYYTYINGRRSSRSRQ